MKWSEMTEAQKKKSGSSSLRYYYRNRKKCLESNKRSRRNNPFYAEKQREAKQRLRTKALVLYGNKCVCCGETESKFLCFDHINGRKKGDTRTSSSQYSRLIRENPLDIQILCHNCNMAKGFYGRCPHTN